MQLAHVIVNGNSFFRKMIVAVGASLDMFKSNRNRGCLFQCRKKVLILRHIAGQLVYSDRGKLFSFRLRYIKDRYHLVGRNGDFLFFGNRLSVRSDKGHIGFRIKLFHFLLYLKGCRGDNADSFFSFFDRSSVAVFPCTKACNQGSVGLLQCNQHGIIKAVMMKL